MKNAKLKCVDAKKYNHKFKIVDDVIETETFKNIMKRAVLGILKKQIMTIIWKFQDTL